MATNVTSDFEDEKQEIQIYPNPFNSMVNIIKPEGAAVIVYDVRGRLIERLDNRFWEPDRNLSSGIYYITIKDRDRIITKKVSYLK